MSLGMCKVITLFFCLTFHQSEVSLQYEEKQFYQLVIIQVNRFIYINIFIRTSGYVFVGHGRVSASHYIFVLHSSLVLKK